MITDVLTPAQIDRFDAAEWTSRTGEVRYYLNGWAQAIGLEAEGLRSIRVWMDTSGTVHVTEPLWTPIRLIDLHRVPERVADALEEE